MKSFTIKVPKIESDKNKIQFRIYKTRKAMLDANEKSHSWNERLPNDTMAITSTVDYWPEARGRIIATIWLNEQTAHWLNVVHEAVHAAQHIYYINYVKENDTAEQHLGDNNEELAYLVSDITALAIAKLDELNFFGRYDD